MPSSGLAADAARAAFRRQVEAKGHAVTNVRQAIAGLNASFARGDLQLTPGVEQMLADLHVALQQDDGQNLGGKSAEAGRFIARALMRELDRA